MDNAFKTIIYTILDRLKKDGLLEGISECADMPLKLTHAFLTAITNENSMENRGAIEILSSESNSPLWGDTANFYLKGISLIKDEIDNAVNESTDFHPRLESLAHSLSERHSISEQGAVERLWSIFFPEGCGILHDKSAAEQALRNKRRVKITALNPDPVTDPASEVIFTSNVLITLPPEGAKIEELNLSNPVKEHLADIMKEKQLYWYDHPMEMGVCSENSEFLYGLKGFDEALRFERERGNAAFKARPVMLMSVSVTHKGLQDISASYLEGLLKDTNCPDNFDLCLFTEKDTQEIVRDVLNPAAEGFLNRDGSDLMLIFGVDGEYGRHYSFLKAIALFWNILINERTKATFKIDLDQIFPQDELVKETGQSAFEHLKTPLWGATGIDSQGMPVELGMLAGALVNNDDIHMGLFTPDIRYPSGALKPDEIIFFSRLPQAVSTGAEMMTRYGKGSSLNGKDECIERIHVTGGTTGILVEALKRHRPFTPSFIGRAEDQAYILSTLFNRPERLAYLHEAGLIMRHDKKSFAREEDMPTQISKLIGDYIRILYFSTLPEVIPGGRKGLKGIMDPYTGCFISHIPLTLVYLRLALKATSLAHEGESAWANELIRSGAKRLSAAIEFCSGKGNRLKGQYERERKAWQLFYDTMSALDDSVRARNPLGLELRKKAMDIVNRCMVKK
jgi:hypothetical protein